MTGANRGIGQALVADALNRGARRVYAGIALYDDLSDPAVLQRHLAVNLLGTHAEGCGRTPAPR